MNKNFFLTLFLLTGIVYGQETLHVDFETVNADIVFNSWNSSSAFSKVENPNSSGINTSSHVGQFTSGNDNGIGIGVIGSTEIFQTPFDLSNINYFKMKVWTKEEIDVTFHLENNPDWGNNFEVTQGVFEGQLNQWVELTFDFSDFSNAYMNNIVLKISGANTTEGDVYYFDDIVGSPLYPPNTSTNPASGATDISIRSNLKISTNSKFKNTDSSELSDLSGTVSLKIGSADGTDVPFTASINDAKNVITLDPSSPLENATTYWYGIIDNALAYENGTEIIGANAAFTSKEASVGPVEEMLFDFDQSNVAIVFSAWDGNSQFEKIANPDPTGINTSANVAQFTAGDGAGDGGGWSPLGANIPSGAVDFTETPFVRVKIWAANPITLTFKFENNPTWQDQAEFSYTLREDELSQWTEVVYNFGSVTLTNQNKINLYFDGARNHTTAGTVYYFDEIKVSDVAPAATFTTNPPSDATEIPLGSKLQINTNLAFRNLDGTAITDFTGKVALKTNDVNGADIPFTASINESKNSITLDPTENLSGATTYWFGILDGTLKTSENELITSVNTTFTTKAAVVGDVVETLFDFDSTNTAVGFESWGGTGFAKIANPDATGINTSDFVGEYTHAGNDSGLENSLVGGDTPLTALDFSETPYIRVKVWVDKPVSVMVRIQNYPDYGKGFEQSIEVTEVNQWVQLIYNFSSVTASNYDRAQIYFDRTGSGESLAGDTYYFDDYEKTNIAPVATFTTNPVSGTADFAVGRALEISTNLDFRNLDDSDIIDLTGKVALKTNNANGTDIPFTAAINETKNTITLDPTENLSGATTYWFGILDGTLKTSENELITSVNTTFTTKAAVVGDVVETLFDFDSTNTAVGFESWGGTGFAKIANPDATGINTSDFVGEYTHAGNDSGLENSLVGGDTPLTALDFSETPYIRVKVWVDKPVSVMVRIQNYPDYGKGFEQSIEVTEVNQWVQLIYNFSSVTASNYDRAQIYFDRTGSGESLAGDTYYFDDYEKTNIAPVATFTTNPVSGTADFAVGRALEISTNLDFRNLDDSDIIDLTGKVALKTNNANGTDIPFTAAINETKNTITLDPDVYLEGETTYWFGIVDGTIETSNNTVVTGVSAMFTTKAVVEQILVDYETFEGGTNFDTWFGDECDFDAAFSNPFQDGNNSSTTVLKYSDTGGQYANVRFDLEENLDLSTNSTFSLMVYVPSDGLSGVQTNQISLKLQDGNTASPWETQTQIDKPVILDQWQEITFDFANDPYVNWLIINTDPEDRTDLNRVVLQMNGENNTDQVIAYIDNIKGPKVSDSGTGNTDFSVPANNFRIAVTGETCLDKGNGKVEIIAIENNTYNATIDNNTYPFVDNTLTIENLASGTYTMCISVANQNFESCFEIEVAQGETLKAAAKVIANKVQIEIEQGTAPYTVYLNEKAVLETYDSALEIEGIHYGDRLEVKTGIACEGSFAKTVATIGTVTALPNPTNGSFEIGLATEEKEVIVSIYNLKSKLLSRKPYPVNSGKIQLNLAGAPSGLYLVKINAEETSTLKIVKH